MKKLIVLLLLQGCLLSVFAQVRQIKGKVTDAVTGEAIADATVMEKGKNAGTKTDVLGNFTLQTTSSAVVNLVVTYVGYTNQTIAANGDVPVVIKLAKKSESFDEVVVIGYGTAKKKDLTGSVVSVKGDEVRKVPAGNVMESLQGKMPGVDITRTSGSAGASSVVTIRGNRSILAGNGPLYIVDGIQYDNYQDINSNDVQSMEVLKDAASTAIYGARGANGVVLITTKKGTSGKVKVFGNAYYGVTDVAGYPKPMTGPQYADLKRQAYRTTGKWNSAADDASIFTNAGELAAVQSGASTYWPGELLQKGSQQDYGIGVAGGNEKTKVYFSFDYFKEKGLLQNDYSGRYALRLNIDQSITNNLKVGLQSQLAYYDMNSRQDGVLTNANKIIPYYGPYIGDSLVQYPGNANQFNPMFDDLPGAYVNKTNTTRLLSTAYVEWKPVAGLSLRSNLGVTNSSSRIGYFAAANTVDRAGSAGSKSRIVNGKITNLSWENIINWQKKVNDHNFDVTLVSSYLSYLTDSSSAEGTGQLLPGQSFYALQNNPSNLLIGSNYVKSNLFSGAFRLNYGYKGKYLLTVTGREDGSSILSKENRWSFFPSVAAAWRMIDENFLQNQHLFSDMKFRASYGEAGNAAVKPYSTQSGLILIPQSWNDKSALAYSLSSQSGNPDLKWERTATLNFGFDFAMFNNRLSASIDYYDSKTRDLLLQRTLPGSTGYNTVVQNIGKTRNNGIEIAINTVNIQSKNFRWTSSVAFTSNKERIEELVGKQNDIANSWFIGSPVKSFYDYQKIGIWQTADSALAKTFGGNPGDIRVADLRDSANGKPDGKITANDRTVLGSAVPKYSFGFANDFKYKNFDLNIYIYVRQGQMFVSSYANKFEPNAIENGANVDYWTPENPTNDYPRPNSGISRAALPYATTLGYKDGSFVKIRNITLGYTFPVRVASKMHISNLRWYVSAKNYFTFSKVKDYDPEGGGSFESPLSKLLVMGLNIDL